MGTRADFYVGIGKEAEWLGSIPWDGYPSGISENLLKSQTLEEYKQNVNKFFATEKGVSRPEDGWPWPWENSRLTDYTYAFNDGKVVVSHFGSKWFDPLKEEPEEGKEWDYKIDPTKDESRVEFPDMTKAQKVTFGDRSGLIVMTMPKD